MSTTSTVTMEELESERAELLPSRETLHCGCGCYSPHGIVLFAGILFF